MSSRYRIEAPLGVGPDGVVHRAVAERLGARPVALRRLPVPTGAARRRLRHDAEAIASLGHHGLAVVEDIADIDEDHVLVASTLGTLGTLADRLLLGPLAVDDAVAVIRAVAEALDAAHRLGLVHGRVSAGNVVLTEHGPVVCDLAQSGALGRCRDGDAGVARDTADAVRLATTLVDEEDRSTRAMAYRTLCRWSSETEVGLDGFVAALERLERLEQLERLDTPVVTSAPVLPPPAETHRPASDGAIGLVISLSLATGVLVGTAATLLPIVR